MEQSQGMGLMGLLQLEGTGRVSLSDVILCPSFSDRVTKADMLFFFYYSFQVCFFSTSAVN